MATRARAEGDYWATYLRDDVESHLRIFTMMLHCVKQTMLGMPDAWFQYLNYLLKTLKTDDEANVS